MALPAAPPKPVILPTPLPWDPSPNESARYPEQIAYWGAPHLVVLHRPVGSYHGSVRWLQNPNANASSHIVTEGNSTGRDVATQLVAWHRKAWTQGDFNSVSYGLEVDDDAWDGDDLGAAFTAARITAFLCAKTGIPPAWTRKPWTVPGVVRHYDLGARGGGHTDPTTDEAYWRWFVRQVRREFDRGGFRSKWGRGELRPIRKR